MKPTRTLFVIIILQIVCSCGSKNDDAENQNHREEPTVEKSIEKAVKPFSVGKVTKNTFFQNEDFADLVDYVLIFDLENSTDHKITALEIESEINTEFQDPEFQAGMHVDIDKTQQYFNKLSWLPKEVKTFKLYFSGNQYGGTSKEDFERTPRIAELKIKIRAESISVDDEAKFSMTFTDSLLDQWKEYQTKLGLRNP